MMKIFIMFELLLPEKLRDTPEIEIDIVFKKGLAHKKFFLKKNPFANLPRESMVLSTLQKDNEIQWIKDWMTYYCLEHEVRYIALYDNKSSNYPEIEKTLSGMSLPLTCILIQWDYPKAWFRVQSAANNHCTRLLGDRGTYYLNFDIDEYLVNRSDLTLKQYLDTNRKKRTRYFSFFERQVPRYLKKAVSDKEVRITDFQFVRDRPTSATKTISILGREGTINVHCTYSNEKSLLVPLVLLDRFVKQLIRLTDLLLSSSCLRCGIARRPIELFKKIVLLIRKRFLFRVVSFSCVKVDNDLYYNHYKGINTGWRVDHKKHETLPPRVVEDSVMIEKLRQLGFHEKK